MWWLSLSFVFDVLILRANLTLEELLMLRFRELEAEWGLNTSLLVFSRRVLPKGIGLCQGEGAGQSGASFLVSHTE